MEPLKLFETILFLLHGGEKYVAHGGKTVIVWCVLCVVFDDGSKQFLKRKTKNWGEHPCKLMNCFLEWNKFALT